MDFAILALMIAAAAYNVYGIVQVGPENASSVQWLFAGVMIVLVVARIIRMSRGRH